MPKYAVIAEMDWSELLIVEADDQTKAFEIAIAKTIAWCQETSSDWLMRLKPAKYVGDTLGCNGTPIRSVILEPIGDCGEEIELWMPSDPDIEHCCNY